MGYDTQLAQWLLAILSRWSINSVKLARDCRGSLRIGIFFHNFLGRESHWKETMSLKILERCWKSLNVSLLSDVHTLRFAANHIRQCCSSITVLQLCSRGLPMSIYPSVHPSVCQTCELWQYKTNLCPLSYTIWKDDSSGFLTRIMVGGECPLLSEILGQTDSSLQKQRKTFAVNLWTILL